MTTLQQRKLGLSSLVLLGLIFVAAVMATNTLLVGLRIDLTENKLYTVSPGTIALLESIEEPINLYYFFSDGETADIPFLRGYATRVQETLEEFVSAAEGQLNLQVIDPVPFSEDEDRAVQFGLEPISLGTLGDAIYFGLAGTNSVGEEDVIGFFQPNKENFLEYDLAKLIYNLSNPDKTVIGLLSGVNMTAGFDPQTQQMTEPWMITTQARQLFEVRVLTPSLTTIEEDIDLLWLVHPKAMDEQTTYAVDQFVLRGGRALIFVDPLAEIDSASAGNPAMGGFPVPSSSNLDQLFQAWGVVFSAGEVVTDNVYALSINTGLGQRPVRHPGLIGIQSTSMDAEDVVTSGLSSINLGMVGHFTAQEDAEIELVPLLTSSAESATVAAQTFQFLPDPGSLLDNFSPTGETYILAARVQGPLRTAFPGGAPEAEGSDEAAEPVPGSAPQHLNSTDSANLILVGDVDILSDRLWVQMQSFLGQRLATTFANNGDFVINALDNLSGSAALIGIRSRATFSRPFTTVDGLRRAADARFRQTEQRLQAELNETEQKLGELQTARDDETSLLMSSEQRVEIQRFLDEQVRIRQELRAVQLDLNRSIDQLGTTLKVINIGLVPVLLTVLALAMVTLRRRRAG